MISLIRRYLIGGETGSRESGLFAFLVWCFALQFAIRKEAEGVAMSSTFDLLTALGFIVVPAFIGPKIYHRYLKSEGKG